jgi:cysteine desulfurase
MQSTEVFHRYFENQSAQIIFTSGATEAINTFFASFCFQKKGHILAGVTEHSATIAALKKWACEGWIIEWLHVDNKGEYDLENLKNSIRSDTKLIVLMATNNETGTNTDLCPLGSFLQSKGIDLFVDAVAAAGKSPFKWFEGLTATVISAHKFHGPTGLGVLALRKGFKMLPLLVGGSQQKGLRAGTVNLPLVASAAAALEAFLKNQNLYFDHMRQLQSHFEKKIQEIVDNTEINGGQNRAYNVSNLFFKDIEAETLVIQLDHLGICTSQGSACQSGASEPSYVIQSMHGLARAKSSVRFSFSRMNTMEEIELSLSKIKQAVDFQRSLALL